MSAIDFLTDKTVIFFIANSIYVFSYMLTSMFWLRLLAIIAAISTFPYFYFQAEPLWSALFWQGCFLAVNLVNLVILIYSMRPPSFDTFEKQVHKLKFSDLKPHEISPILKLAQRMDLEDGAILLKDGESNHCLFLVVEGRCNILKNGNQIALLESGEFAGELSFVSGEVISADVVSAGNTRIMYWDREALEPLFNKHGLYKSYLHSLCSIDIAQKLRRLTTTVADTY
jgi:hypothetical protein